MELKLSSLVISVSSLIVAAVVARVGGNGASYFGQFPQKQQSLLDSTAVGLRVLERRDNTSGYFLVVFNDQTAACLQ